MKVWHCSVDKEFTEFLVAHGVNLPRAWSQHMREESSKSNSDNRLRTFRSYLIAEHPTQYAAWRVLGGNK